MSVCCHLNHVHCGTRTVYYGTGRFLGPNCFVHLLTCFLRRPLVTTQPWPASCPACQLGREAAMVYNSAESSRELIIPLSSL